MTSGRGTDDHQQIRRGLGLHGELCPILGADWERRLAVSRGQMRPGAVILAGPSASDVLERLKQRLCSPVCSVRDEEAAGSNPATPTIKLQVAVLFGDLFRLTIPAAFRFWERTEADLVQPTSLTSGNVSPFVRRVGAAA